MISFGQIDYSEVVGGEKGLNYYSNLAIDQWGLLMDDFLYNGTDMTLDAGAKIALIDSGNTSIQLPTSMYIQVMNAMRRTERTIISQEVDDTQILVARKPCYKLWDTLGDIEFKLQDTKIIIKPRGYLYHMEGQDDCFIGI